jgi:heat shock protein HslJ
MVGLFVISANLCASCWNARAQGITPETSIRTRSLAGTKWNLNEIDGQRIPRNGLQPYFVLKVLERSEYGSSGRMEDATDNCGNHLTGIYRVSDDRLRIHVLSSTLKACRPPNANLSAYLGEESRFRVHGETLELLDGQGAVKARFIADRSE